MPQTLTGKLTLKASGPLAVDKEFPFSVNVPEINESTTIPISLPFGIKETEVLSLELSLTQEAS